MADDDDEIIDEPTQTRKLQTHKIDSYYETDISARERMDILHSKPMHDFSQKPNHDNNFSHKKIHDGMGIIPSIGGLSTVHTFEEL